VIEYTISVNGLAQQWGLWKTWNLAHR